MWVKITRGCIDLGYAYRESSSGRNLPDEIAKVLIRHGRAVPIPDPTPKKEKQPEVKTAVVTKARKRPVKKDGV